MMGSGKEVLAAPLSEVPLPPGDVTARRTRTQDVLLVFSISLMMIVSIMSNQSITIALPVLGRELGIDRTDLQWPVTSYALAFGCLLLLLGRLADIFGRKPMFLAGCFVFGTFNIACGLSKSLVQLAVFRALTGIGAAGAVPAGVGIIARTFPPSSRTRSIAFACFSAGAPIGSGLGSLFGGVFTQWSTWRGVFYLTAGMAYLPMAIGWFTIDSEVLDPQRDKRVDWLGGFLSTAGITLLTFGLGAGPTAPDQWRTPYVVVALVLGLLLCAGFVLWEHLLVRLERFSLPPLMPLRIFRQGRLGPCLAVLFLSWAAFQPVIYHATLYFQEYLGLSPIMTTVRFLPTAIVGLIVNFIFAVLVPYVPGWILITVGCLCGALSALLFAVINTQDSYWQWAFPALTLAVFLADLLFATSSLYVANVARPEEQSLAGALIQVATQVSVALGLAITTVVNDSVAAKDALDAFGIIADAGHENIPKSSYLLGLRGAQWTSFAFGMAASVLAVAFLRSIGILGHKKQRKQLASTADDNPTDYGNEKGGDDLEATGQSADTLRPEPPLLTTTTTTPLEREATRSTKSLERA